MIYGEDVPHLKSEFSPLRSEMAPFTEVVRSICCSVPIFGIANVNVRFFEGAPNHYLELGERAECGVSESPSVCREFDPLSGCAGPNLTGHQ